MRYEEMRREERLGMNDEEWWAEQDRRMRLLEKLRKAFIYLAGMALCAAFLFVLLFFGVRNMGEGKYDHWAELIRQSRIETK